LRRQLEERHASHVIERNRLRAEVDRLSAELRQRHVAAIAGGAQDTGADGGGSSQGAAPSIGLLCSGECAPSHGEGGGGGIRLRAEVLCDVRDRQACAVVGAKKRGRGDGDHFWVSRSHVVRAPCWYPYSCLARCILGKRALQHLLRIDKVPPLSFAPPDPSHSCVSTPLVQRMSPQLYRSFEETRRLSEEERAVLRTELQQVGGEDISTPHPQIPATSAAALCRFMPSCALCLPSSSAFTPSSTCAASAHRRREAPRQRG